MTLEATHNPEDTLTAAAAQFAADGYLVLPGFLDDAVRMAVIADVEAALHPVLAPAEFETDVGYPGAPASRDAPGGDTPRRLLNAYARFAALRPSVTAATLGRYLAAVLGTHRVLLSQCHHNCVMTKAPGFSSVTLWHQDIRYWSFERPELISLWIALGEEIADNGALQVIPGSHRQAFTAERLDDVKFLRSELPENQALIRQARTVALAPGDALLFHCRLFHAAGRNLTERVKLSAVFTYHAADNRPLPGTRSARFQGIPVEAYDR